PAPLPMLNNPKLLSEIFSDDSIKAKRNTTAVEVAPSVLVAAHVVESKPAELQPLDAVKADIEKKLVRQEAVRLAREEGEAKLKEIQAGKDAGVKWPAPLAVSRQKPGGLPPTVIDKAFRADPKKLPAVVGVDNGAMGYSLLQVSKVIEGDKVDDAQRNALGSQLRDAVAASDFESTLGSLRDRVGVTVRSGALDAKPK
ncbi:MAG TPA: peptidylprolyl isomerase, partial [Usitatibacter sp.]|nr:peptidylprolyl isomerase [Usitatibacter sp.]